MKKAYFIFSALLFLLVIMIVLQNDKKGVDTNQRTTGPSDWMAVQRMYPYNENQAGCLSERNEKSK